ncbi:hypothetical protein [Streptomyces yangpuensis]|uniref:hypothetical protein n=1 Tax=Streptomyces yangpuensis TaxID=1648182 RepID=UPI003816AF7B
MTDDGRLAVEADDPVDAAMRRADRRVDEALSTHLDLAAGLAAVRNRSQRSEKDVSAPLAPLGLAQDVLARIGPDQLSLLPSHIRATEVAGEEGGPGHHGRPAARPPRRKRQWLAGVAGWGSGGPSDVVTLLAPVVAAVAHEVVRYFTAEALDARADRWRDRVRERSDEVRRIVRMTGREAGLSEESVEELADAVVEALDAGTD